MNRSHVESPSIPLFSSVSSSFKYTSISSTTSHFPQHTDDAVGSSSAVSISVTSTALSCSSISYAPLKSGELITVKNVYYKIIINETNPTPDAHQCHVFNVLFVNEERNSISRLDLLNSNQQLLQHHYINATVLEV